MPTPEQQARSMIAAYEARKKAATPPAPTADEQAITAKGAADFVLPNVSETIRGMATPYNLVTTGAEMVGGAYGGPAGAVMAGRAAQLPATAAQRAWEGKPVMSGETLTDTAWNTAMNEVATRYIAPGMSKAFSWIGQSTPVQNFRQGVAKRVLGRITPDARSSEAFAREMIDDVEKVVNQFRAGTNQPLYSRDQLEERLNRVLPALKAKGAFTIGDLTEGGKIDFLEGVSQASSAGKGQFASLREAQETLFNEWPKVFAALLGDSPAGPDQLASMAAQSIRRGLKKKAAVAGGIIESVESAVGNNVVDFDETLLNGLTRQIQLFAKTNAPMGKLGKVKVDPEGIDAQLQSAIDLVQRATGKQWNPATNTFSEVIDPALASQPPQVLAAMRAQGVLPPSPKQSFTWTDAKTLRGNLSTLAQKSAGKDNNQSSAVLGELSDAVERKMFDVLDAEDAIRGAKAGQPGSLRTTWEMGRNLYKQAMDLRDGFQAQGWIEALDQAGQGSRVIKEIWPNDADTNRIGQLRDLMGGEGSPYWKTLRRFKMEELIETHGQDPQKLIQLLTSSTKHSRDYWIETLGKDQYNRFQKFARTLAFSQRKNPGQARLLGSMVDAGMVMRVAQRSGQVGTMLPLAVFGGTGSLPAATASLVGAGVVGAGWLVTNKKLAQWLTDPNDSKMLMSLMHGNKITLKARTWFRNQVARAVADASKTDEPDIRPIPSVVPRAGYATATGRKQ